MSWPIATTVTVLACCPAVATVGAPVTPAEVTLDYILDERARELIFEEDRRVTLQRTGKLVERVRKYNNLNKGNIQDFHALFPIPFAEIEANKDAVLAQNPGY